MIDDLKPDFVLNWGDDQYKIFKEDNIGSVCVLAYEHFAGNPLNNLDGSYRSNVWDKPQEKTFT